MSEIHIGSVLVYRINTNPYVYARTNTDPQDTRGKVLQAYLDTGALPKGWGLWNDVDRRPVTSEDTIVGY